MALKNLTMAVIRKAGDNDFAPLIFDDGAPRLFVNNSAAEKELHRVAKPGDEIGFVAVMAATTLVPANKPATRGEKKKAILKAAAKKVGRK